MSYSFQTFSSGQALSNTHINQMVSNVQDHVHGTSSVSTLKLDSNSTLVLDDSAAIVANSINNGVVSGTNSYAFYKLSIRSDSTSVYWTQGVYVSVTETIQVACHAYLVRQAAGDSLRMVNGTGNTETAVYRVYQLFDF